MPSKELDGRPVPEGHHARHSCDNPRCVNPSHLAAGTPKQNVTDARERGRLAVGARHYAAKLTEENVREIRTSVLSQRALAAQFGVNPSNIAMIQSRKTWTHVL